VYKSKSSFLLFLVVLSAAAAQLQWRGVRWGDLGQLARIEARVDLASLHDDMRSFQGSMKSVPSTLRAFWFDFRSNMLALQADAAVESELAAERFYPAAQDRRFQ